MQNRFERLEGFKNLRGLSETVTTLSVSYTHLDVYKRQHTHTHQVSQACKVVMIIVVRGL